MHQNLIVLNDTGALITTIELGISSVIPVRVLLLLSLLLSTAAAQVVERKRGRARRRRRRR